MKDEQPPCVTLEMKVTKEEFLRIKAKLSRASTFSEMMDAVAEVFGHEVAARFEGEVVGMVPVAEMPATIAERFSRPAGYAEQLRAENAEAIEQSCLNAGIEESYAAERAARDFLPDD